MDPKLRRVLKFARDVVVPALRKAAKNRSAASTSTPSAPGSAPSAPTTGHRDARRGEVDTAEARPKISYAPVRDDDADPGEVVWAWVPYEDDPSQGKDRPLLVIGHIEDDVAALALTSRERDDRHHHALGGGPWDRQGRPSWVKLDRLLRLDPDAIRREGAVLDQQRFQRVVEAWQAY